MDITVVTLATDPGAFSGSGFYNPDPSYTWAVTGHLNGSVIDFHILYTGSNAGYTVDTDTGLIAADGTLSGTAHSNGGQTFDWASTAGAAKPFPATTAADCGTGASFVSSLGGVTNVSTVAGHKYEVTASGTFYAGGNSTYDIRADAEYSQDAYQRLNGLPWTDSVRTYESYGEVLLDLMVNGNNIDWGAYNAGHVYKASFVAPDASTQFAFNIYDIYAPNNTGGLCVALKDLGNIGTFEGFFSPIDNRVKNVAKAGQAIPVKWRILDWNGNPVSDPNSFVSITSKQGAGLCSGLSPDPIEEYAGMSGLQYLGDGYWQFNWKTPKTYAGQCREMTLTLADGSVHTADFLFR
jgi:hypothetical protein